MSLGGATVVVTRSEAQSGALVELIIANGGVPIAVPLIEVIDDRAGLAELERIADEYFDWLVVTSPNGAERWMRPGLRPTVGSVAAVGRSTAEAMGTCDLIPDQQHGAGLVDAFADGSGSVLVVQAADAAATVVSGLIARGWTVTVVTVYLTRPVRPTGDLLQRAATADAVLFASGSAAKAWVEVFGPTAPPLVVAMGPQTAQACAAAGLTVTSVAAAHTLQGMIDALLVIFEGFG